MPGGYFDGLNNWIPGTPPESDAESIEGIDIVSTAPSTGQGLVYNGTAWAPATLASAPTLSANQVYAGPTSGSPATAAGRALVAGDIPAIAESGVTNLTSDLAAKAPLASPTFTGTLTITGTTVVNTGTLTLPTSTDTLVGRATTDTLANKTLVGAAVDTHTSPVATVSNSSGTTTCNAANNESFATTLSASTTALLITNAVAAQTIKVKVTQAASGGPFALTYSGTNTITWFTAGAGAPGVPQTAGGAFYLILICTGTNTFDGYSLPFSSAT